MPSIRKLTAALTLSSLAAFAPLALAGGGGPIATTDPEIIRTAVVYDDINYVLYNPVDVVDLPVNEGLRFAFPVDAEVIDTALDDEDLVTTFRTAGDLVAVGDYYRELFADQELLEVVEDVAVTDERATALYRYGDEALLRWTVEPVEDGVYRVVYDFEPL